MSFSSEQKGYIIKQQYKSCCRKCMIHGALSADAYVNNTDIVLSVEKREVAEALSRLIKEFYGTSPVASHMQKGGRCYQITFASKSASEYIQNLSFDGLYTPKCDQCLSSFLRGLYLSCGRFSDPQKQYALEFTLKYRSDIISKLFESLGLKFGVSKKNAANILYIKSSESIEEFCAYSGLNRALFSIIDARAEGEIRKNVMRVANCETNNIAKTVEAARGQLEIIRALDSANLLSSLPEELEATARLRLQYADLSLSQLSAVSIPPISKPGLSHRLKRIIEIGEQLLSKK